MLSESRTVRRRSNMLGQEQAGEVVLYEERGLSLAETEMWAGWSKRKHLEAEVREHGGAYC